MQGKKKDSSSILSVLVCETREKRLFSWYALLTYYFKPILADNKLIDKKAKSKGSFKNIETYFGQSQSPGFMRKSGATSLGPVCLHLRHRKFLAKLTKLHLQNNIIKKNQLQYIKRGTSTSSAGKNLWINASCSDFTTNILSFSDLIFYDTGVLLRLATIGIKKKNHHCTEFTEWKLRESSRGRLERFVWSIYYFHRIT